MSDISKAPVKRKIAKKKVTKKKPAAKKTPPPPMMLNQQSWDQKAVMDFLCDCIATSSLSIEKILKSVTWNMPNRRTIFAWLDADKSLDHQYARAREAQADFMLDEINDIADNVGSPLIIDNMPFMVDGKVVMLIDAAAVAHAKLQIDTRKWTMSKVAPKKYGEKVQHEGEIGLHMTIEAVAKRIADERAIN